MMQVEEVTKRFARVYRTVDGINNFLLRIRLTLSDDTEENATFKWQQKRFSPEERELYSDAKNCITDKDKEYHEMIKKERRGHESILFSYIIKDNYAPEEKLLQTRRSITNKGNELVRLMSSMHINAVDTDTENEGKESFEYDYFKSLYDSSKNVLLESKYDPALFETMYIMADFGEYYQSTWIKNEYPLCIIKYSPCEQLLILTPDFTLFEPHILKITTDETRTINYRLENASLDGITRQELLKEVEILHQVALKSKPKSSTSASFEWTEKPHQDVVNVHVFLEIRSAWNFENDNIFVRYYLDLTEGWKLLESEEVLTGVTTACARGNSHNKRMYFGFPVDFTLVSQYGRQGQGVEDPVIYFELISKDTWCRYRCEGLTHSVLPIWLPGARVERLHCHRVTSPDGNAISGELRRWFIGDCTNYEDIRSLGPQTHQRNEVVNRMATQTISTGILEVKTSVMHVLPCGAQATTSKNYLREMHLREKLRDPQLTKTVEEAVEAFKKARAAMTLARHAVHTTIEK